ncbi:hypothetical protein [Methylobacterium sp. CM6247]
MSASVLNNRSTHERVIDIALFLLSQSDTPTLDNWYDAVDDMFGDFSESAKQRVVEAGIVILESRISSEPHMPQRIAA